MTTPEKTLVAQVRGLLDRLVECRQGNNDDQEVVECQGWRQGRVAAFVLWCAPLARPASARTFGVDLAASPEHADVVKVREVLQRLQKEGWVLRRQKGSHRQFFHAAFPDRRVTVSGKPNLEVPKGTLN